MPKDIRIGIAEDHLIVRQGIVKLLNQESGIKVIFDVGNGIEVMNALKKSKIDVLIIDLSMPIVDGKTLLKNLEVRHPDIKSIILSATIDQLEIVECLQLGAKAYLPKQVDFEIIVDAIFQVNEGLHYLDKNVSEAVITTLRTKPNSVRRSELSLLNEKEIEVIRLVCNGLKNQEIADHLCLSTRTIEGIRLQISKKTKTNKVVDLIYFALKNRIHTIQ
jgi:DNA-binding NarL/FixJ family response regulator